MKKLSLTALLLFGVLAFTANLHAQTTPCTKAEKKACAKIAQADAGTSFYSLLTVAPAEQKAETTNETPTAKKANCQKICTPAQMAKMNCDPKDCPPGCIPACCKLKASAASSAAPQSDQKPEKQL